MAEPVPDRHESTANMRRSARLLAIEAVVWRNQASRKFGLGEEWRSNVVGAGGISALICRKYSQVKSRMGTKQYTSHMHNIPKYPCCGPSPISPLLWT
eukprot:scaffold7183_cov60-Phaeocystis_antarctica.AAC.2